jgi:hypothetical protein
MNKLNNLHPTTRYGIAAAWVRIQDREFDTTKRSDLWDLASLALQDLLSEILLAPFPGKDSDTIYYKPLSGDKLNPGSKTGQNAPNGYFTQPHVLTSNNVADIVKEAKAIIELLKKGDTGKNYELKRSYAPMIAKINAGKKSMSNPKVDLLDAAFTCIGTLTPLKPAAFVKDMNDKFANAGIIPELPFFDKATGEYPLKEFIELFREMISKGLGEKAYAAKSTKEKKYNRPNVFRGNYPQAPAFSNLNIVSLIAAIGKWSNEYQLLIGESRKVIELLENRPIYIVSYIGSRQEQFGHHLVDLAMTGQLYTALNKRSRVSLVGVEDTKKYSTPNWQLFIRSFDNFLRFFDKMNFQNFLAHRATYPIEFFQILKSYFMQTGKFSEEIINAAVSYGQSINRAAYIAASQEISDDKQKNRSGGRSMNEYKHRVLLQLESIINSSESGVELVSRLNSQIGRLTMQDIHSGAAPFLKKVSNNIISIEDAKHLTTAFMRLSAYDPNHTGTNDTTKNSAELTDGVPS